MANKTVVLSCNQLSITVHNVTEVKIKEELDSDKIKTFDGPIVVPSSDAGFSVDVSLLDVQTVWDFINLKSLLNLLKKNPGEMTVFEMVKLQDGTEFLTVNHLSGVVLSSNEVTYSPEDLTARNVSFKAQTLTENVNGMEIKQG